MVNEIDNAIKYMQSMANSCMAVFSGNNTNPQNMNIRRAITPQNTYVQPQNTYVQQNTGIKFSDMGSRNVRLSSVVRDSNPVVNGIKFNSD